jgi:hypothetical protein
MSLQLVSQGKTDSKKFGRNPITETDLRGEHFFHSLNGDPQKVQLSPEDISLRYTKIVYL